MDSSLLTRFKGRRVLVLGDVMLDRFVYGKVERISPEAPIPVLHCESERSMLGGAGNVARNIVTLGGEAVLVGIIGQDSAADELEHSLCAHDKVEGAFLRLNSHPTTVKVRYVSGGQQIMRADTEQKLHLDEKQAKNLFDIAANHLTNVSAVVLSDYAKGVLCPAVLRNIIDLANQKNLPIVVDPKSRDVKRYAGATVITPNESEAASIADTPCGTDEAAGFAAEAIQKLAGTDSVVLTRGARGMTIYGAAQGVPDPVHVKSAAQEVFDVSGAGDTVVACLTLALASGLDLETGARMANIAAGIAVGKTGTAPVFASELGRVLDQNVRGMDPKIATLEDAERIIAEWKEKRLSVGFTNGVFDLLHPGHIELLKQAHKSCDRLIVALNSDTSVRRLKGDSRPIQNERARAMVMASLATVDLVTVFDEETPMQQLEIFRPDVLIKGGDYTHDSVIGASFVESYGGRVVLVPLHAGHSTTSVISRATLSAS